MLYLAIDVAKHIVTYCTKQKKPISNLKLQKMLYYVWIDYYKSTNMPLYIDDICAWQFGPVVPDVYYEFCSYAGTAIYREYNDLCSEEDAAIIDATINKLINLPACALVGKTHEEGKPWDVVFNGGNGLREVIPFSLIVELECRM